MVEVCIFSVRKRLVSVFFKIFSKYITSYMSTIHIYISEFYSTEGKMVLV